MSALGRKLLLIDARSDEVREITTDRIGGARWEETEKGRLIVVEIKTAGASEWVPIRNPAADFVEQVMYAAPGGSAILAFSPDPVTGWLRTAMSVMVGAGWTLERIRAATELSLQEALQVRARGSEERRPATFPLKMLPKDST